MNKDGKVGGKGSRLHQFLNCTYRAQSSISVEWDLDPVEGGSLLEGLGPFDKYMSPWMMENNILPKKVSVRNKFKSGMGSHIGHSQEL